MPLSQLGNVPNGKIAVLMNTKGNAKKLIIAINESTALTEKATAVKRQENPNASSEKAANTPRMPSTPKPAAGCNPLGRTKATMKVSNAMNMAFAKFCNAPEKNIEALDIGEAKREFR
jgi:hypothetical protein